ncbi:elongation factor 1-gamma, partial [Trichonephila clavata]
PSVKQPYRCVNRFFKTCINQPHFKAVLGEVTLCEKMAQFDAKTLAKFQKELGQGKKAKEATSPKDDKKKKKEEKKPKT